MAFGEYMQNQQMLGSDEGDVEKTAAQSSEGAVVIETLVNIRIVAALSMEGERVRTYTKALENQNKNNLCRNTIAGTGQGLGSFFQMWGTCFENLKRAYAVDLILTRCRPSLTIRIRAYVLLWKLAFAQPRL